MLRKCLAVCVTVALVSALSGCEKPGPTQRMGEKVDNLKESVQDTVNPKGPVEKAGRAVDKAVNQ